MITDTQIECSKSTEYQIDVHMGIYKSDYEGQPFENEISEMSESVEVER